jgi:hypothetical protein
VTTPADELKAAAEKIRTLAMGAPANNQPWRYAKGLPNDSVRTATGWEVAYGDAPGDLRYIAAMHPGIGLALAELLDTAAEYFADDSAAHPTHLVRALTVARAINGSEQP